MVLDGRIHLAIRRMNPLHMLKGRLRPLVAPLRMSTDQEKAIGTAVVGLLTVELTRVPQATVTANLLDAHLPALPRSPPRTYRCLRLWPS